MTHEHEGAVAALDDIEERLAKVREEAQQADRDKAGLTARKEALELGLSVTDRVAACRVAIAVMTTDRD